MYTLDLICSNGHRFEGWFGGRAGFEKQREMGLISCMICGDTSVEQILTPVRIGKHSDKAEPQQVAAPKEAPKAPDKVKVMEFFEKHFEDVGKRFADEAIKIHIGDSERRNIRGVATADEEKTLTEEGISFFKLPNFQ